LESTGGILLASAEESGVGLCSRRLGFPFPSRMKARSDGLLEGILSEGLGRVLKPVEHLGEIQQTTFLYQPIFERGLAVHHSDELFETEYVKSNCLEFGAGLGCLFLQRGYEVVRYSGEPSGDWIPKSPVGLRDAYRVGRSWVYAKLDARCRSELPPNHPLRAGFRVLHDRLLSSYEEFMGA
jgi:hypothetical protein